ncbi:MAG: dihydroneopterin aldolase [Gammaproteobacteria bacterium]|nr:dihydroneopterin aldolase [Gammaproteobacteria bacterium]
MRDTIFLRELAVEAVIGIQDWERRVRQLVKIDLEMAVDAKRAAASDRIEDTLNYKRVAKRLIEFVSGSEYQLVETLAENIAGIVLNEFSVAWVRVTVNKPGAIRGARDVGIRIERWREG